MFEKNGSMSDMHPASLIIITILMIFGSLEVQLYIFLISLESVVLVSQPTQSLQMTLSLKSENTGW